MKLTKTYLRTLIQEVINEPKTYIIDNTIAFSATMLSGKMADIGRYGVIIDKGKKNRAPEIIKTSNDLNSLKREYPQAKVITIDSILTPEEIAFIKRIKN